MEGEADSGVGYSQEGGALCDVVVPQWGHALACNVEGRPQLVGGQIQRCLEVFNKLNGYHNVTAEGSPVCVCVCVNVGG